MSACFETEFILLKCYYDEQSGESLFFTFVVRMSSLIGWLVVLCLTAPLRQYFSLYRAVSQREGERGEKG